MTIKKLIRKALWRTGYDISIFSPATNSIARKRSLFRQYGINVVLDVGANVGQFARQTRGDVGFAGRIISFEPLKAAFSLLLESSQEDPLWEVINVALGNSNESASINVAGNSVSSSLLEMLPVHLEAAPESLCVSSETVTVRTLDSLMGGLCPIDAGVLLKIDAQGYEKQILEGAEESLRRISTVQLEMSLIPMYRGELSFGEMNEVIGGLGYTLVALEPGFSHPKSGQMFQVDGLYHRF